MLFSDKTALKFINNKYKDKQSKTTLTKAATIAINLVKYFNSF